MADNPNMKKNDLSKRRCRYRIVLEGSTEEQTEKPKRERERERGGGRERERERECTHLIPYII